MRAFGSIIIFIMKNIMTGHANANTKKMTVEDFTPAIEINMTAAAMPTKHIVMWFFFIARLRFCATLSTIVAGTPSREIEPKAPYGSGECTTRLDRRGVRPTRLSF